MRKTVQTLALLASGVGVVFAAAPRGEAPEARAYLSIGYGQAKQVPSQFFYGLRLDHGSDSELQGAAPIAQLSFDRHGFESARLNGLPFTRRLSVNQDEGTGSEGGMFSNYSAVDWTLLAVGAVGIGFAISQVADSKDTPDPAPGSSSGGSSAGGSSGSSSGSGSSGGGVLGGLLLGGYTESQVGGDDRRSAEYAEWLDGGSGQMGDLAPR